MSAIIRKKQLLNKIGLSRSVIYDMIARGEFPRPIRIGRRAMGWLESDIEAWIASRVAAARATDPQTPTPEQASAAPKTTKRNATSRAGRSSC